MKIMRLATVALVLGLNSCSVLAEPEITGSYFAMIVSDIEVSSDWYESALGLTQTTRITEVGRYDVINLSGNGIFVELIQLVDAMDRPDGRVEGPFKVGMLVDDINIFVASLPEHIDAPTVLDDERNGLFLLQLRDPDDQVVQVMQLRVDTK